MVRRKSVSSKAKKGGIFKKISKLFFLIVLIIILIFTILFVFFISSSSEIKNKNIVFVSSEKSGGEGKIIFAQFRKNPAEIIVIGLNKKITNNLIGGYGDYQLGAIKGISEIDKKGRLFERAAFSNFLEIGVDEVVEIKKDQFPKTKFDLLKILLLNRKTVNDALIVKNIKQDSLVFIEIDTLEDWRKYLNSSVTMKLDDNCSVAVVNATEQAGVASLLSNILENSGVSVVRSTNNIWGEPQTKVYLDGEKTDCGQVLKKLQSVSPVELETKIDKSKSAQFRANIVLFIGDKLVEELTE